jgi:Cellulose-binding Sde182, nucleoside hydrolase-like domain
VSRLAAVLVLISFSFANGLGSAELDALAAHRNRWIVLTDIGADPDDTMSMVRLLTYTNVIDIAELVATTSEFQETQVHPEMIEKIIDAYERAQPNLGNYLLD